jgi:hypothetical protein
MPTTARRMTASTPTEPRRFRPELGNPPLPSKHPYTVSDRRGRACAVSHAVGCPAGEAAWLLAALLAELPDALALAVWADASDATAAMRPTCGHAICKVVGAADGRSAALTCGRAEVAPCETARPPLASVRSPIRKPASRHELPDTRQSSSVRVGSGVQPSRGRAYRARAPSIACAACGASTTRAPRPESARRRDHLLAVALEPQRA